MTEQNFKEIARKGFESISEHLNVEELDYMCSRAGIHYLFEKGTPFIGFLPRRCVLTLEFYAETGYVQFDSDYRAFNQLAAINKMHELKLF
ncbi:MAG: hypothetical protein ACRBFS_19580 [Aureispira sp.]